MVSSSGGAMAFKFNRSIGMTVLAMYLIVVGVSGLIPLGFPPLVMAVIALVAGVLIILGR
jgi:hypothetical protein